MNQFTNHTAILFFSRSATAEAKHKMLMPYKKANKNVTKILLQHSLDTIKKAGLSFYSIDETQQVGTHFGEKLANAFAAVFAKGFANVIAIGNDCLNVDVSLLQEAATQLQKSKMVIGPTAKGGAYLIGLHISAFQKSNFTSLGWQTDQTLTDLLCYGKNLDVHLLVLQADINTVKDLYSVVHGLTPVSKLKFLFLSLLASFSIPKPYNYLSPSSTTFSHLFARRGPPYRICY